MVPISCLVSVASLAMFTFRLEQEEEEEEGDSAGFFFMYAN